MRKFIIYFISLLTLTLIFTSCSSEPTGNVVEVTAKNYRFEAPPEIPAGWTTFHLKNMDQSVHFILLSRLPEGVTFEDYQSQVAIPFQTVLDTLIAGKTKKEAGAMLGKVLPEWFFNSIKPMGGNGLTSRGITSSTTIKLDPGTYVMECYIKENGMFHTTMGMINKLTVTQESSEGEAPEANMEVTLSNDEIETSGEIKSGKNTIAVHFKEHPEIGLGNDVHLVKVNDVSMDSLIQWMDWMNIKGLQTPEPAEFLGGVQEMPVGYTSYFTVDLKPGNYALIAESSSNRGKYLTISVK